MIYSDTHFILIKIDFLNIFEMKVLGEFSKFNLILILNRTKYFVRYEQFGVLWQSQTIFDRIKKALHVLTKMYVLKFAAPLSLYTTYK